MAPYPAASRDVVRGADGHLRRRLLRPPVAPRRPDVGRQLDAARRRPRPELPDQLHRHRRRTRCSCPAVVFTIEYTVIVTIFLIGLGLGLALLVQESGRWSGLLRTELPAAGGDRPGDGLAPVLGLLLADHRTDQPAARGARCDRRSDPFARTSLAALLSTTFLIVWKFAGFYMLILLVGLQAIPSEVFEAAAIDGASRWQTLRRVTLPLLRPSLALALILCITGSLLAFDQFYILTKGGPDNTTVTVVQLIYREAFQRQNLGHRGGPVDHRAGRPVGHQRRPVPRAAVRGPRVGPGDANVGRRTDPVLRRDRGACHPVPVPDGLERDRVRSAASRGRRRRPATGSGTTRPCSTTARASGHTSSTASLSRS